MTTERIDVLAVLDCRIREVEQDGISRATELREARAAVAELIEASNEYMEARRVAANAIGLTESSPPAVRRAAASRRLAAALARVGAP